MITIASNFWATKLSISASCFSIENEAAVATWVTLRHLAASERTAAYDAADQPLIPPPSLIPSFIGLVPQNDVSAVMPDAAISSSTVMAAGAAEADGGAADASTLGATDGALLAASLGATVAAVPPQAPMTSTRAGNRADRRHQPGPWLKRVMCSSSWVSRLSRSWQGCLGTSFFDVGLDDPGIASA